MLSILYSYWWYRNWASGCDQKQLNTSYCWLLFIRNQLQLQVGRGYPGSKLVWNTWRTPIDGHPIAGWYWRYYVFLLAHLPCDSWAVRQICSADILLLAHQVRLIRLHMRAFMCSFSEPRVYLIISTIRKDYDRYWLRTTIYYDCIWVSIYTHHNNEGLLP